MLHVLTNGASNHRAWLRRRFGDAGIREYRGRGLTVERMLPWISRTSAERWQAENPYALLWENR
jgi:hypothetical protein